MAEILENLPLLSLVITVKNEWALLRWNLLYHHHLGVERVFVFDDGATDGTLDTIGDLPFVTVQPSVSPNLFGGQSAYEEFTSKAEEHHTARQNLNTLAAMELAKSIGFDWLIALDADELICPDIQHSYPGHLLKFFGELPADIETVRFSTLEVTQRRLEYENVFAEETLFKKPNAQMRRNIYDPVHKKMLNINGFYGQTMGKSAIRLEVPAKPRTTHKFVALDGSTLNTLHKGFLLHYYCYSYQDFVRKYKNFALQPDEWISGNKIEPQRKLWRDLVNYSGYTDLELRHYYEQWMMMSETEINRLQNPRWLGIIPRKPDLVQVTAARDVFKEIVPFSS